MIIRTITRGSTRRSAITALALSATLMLAACGGDSDGDGDSPTEEAPATPAGNEELRALLPTDIADGGVLSVVVSQYPPFVEINADGDPEGVTTEVARAIADLLGLELELSVVGDLPAILSGLRSNRYHINVGPQADLLERQVDNDFVDWTVSKLAFLVPLDNPDDVQEIADICGLRVAVVAGGSGEQTVQQQSNLCVEAGEEAVEVQSYDDQSAITLAVEAGRADAAGAGIASLLHFAAQNQDLEVAAQDAENILGEVPQGIVIDNRDTELVEAVLAAMTELWDNGTLEEIMGEAGLAEVLMEPALNAATS